MDVLLAKGSNLFVLVAVVGIVASISVKTENELPGSNYELQKPSTTLYEGDIIAYPDDLADDDDQWTHRISRRNAVRNREHLWNSRIIPYEIANNLAFATSFIRSVIEDFASKTCLNFVEKTNQRNWIRFMKSTRCASTVGKLYWKQGSQDILLSQNCLNHASTTHEIMHALGFWHEQSRNDRDDYVSIFWENIEPGAENNFNRQRHDRVDNLGVEYDYDSIMHYDRHFFLDNGADKKLSTIQAIGKPGRPLGNKRGLSAKDVIEINALYQCSREPSVSQQWSAWSSYGPCDANCYKKRQRFCFHANPIHCPGANKYGVVNELQTCTKSECYAPLSGHWGRWSSWSDCNVDCGSGNRIRKRICNDPAPKNGGRTCVGLPIESLKCLQKKCSIGLYGCEFETGVLCGWSVTSSSPIKKYNWRRIAGTTPSAGTGPNGDHTTGAGHFLYAEASAPATVGMETTISSPTIDNDVTTRCMEFSFSMYGRGAGSLKVYKQESHKTGKELLWEERGDQGEDWFLQQLVIVAHFPFKVLITATRGSSFEGDIAIDDIYIKNGSCHSNLPSNILHTPPHTDVMATAMFRLIAEGCFTEREGQRSLPHLLLTHRAPTGEGTDGHSIEWDNFPASVDLLLRECAQLAMEQGISVIGVHFYGECWSTKDTQATKTLKNSTECVNGKYKPCASSTEACVGLAESNYIYTIVRQGNAPGR